MNIRNEDIAEIAVEIPEGHRHIRTKVVFMDGSELVFQEAALSNLLRAFVTIKTHPLRKSVLLRGRPVADAKPGYAEWQLLEE